MNINLRAQHYLLIIAAVAGAVWFFTGYPSQDPRSAMQITLSQKEVEAKAIEELAQLGYAVSDYSISTISILSSEHLMDSLQADLGRPRAVNILEDHSIQNIKPYFWKITFRKREGAEKESSANAEPGGEDCEGVFCIQMDMKGRFIAFQNPSNMLPRNEINREALSAVFASEVDSIGQLFDAVSDSLLGRLLYFDMQKQAGDYGDYSRQPAAKIQSDLLEGLPYRYSKNDAQALAEYFLNKTGWNAASLVRDTVFVERVGLMNAVNIRYTFAEPVLGQQLRLDLLVTPTGSLLDLKSNYNFTPQDNTGPEDFIWDFVIQILILLFVLALFIIFFFRMRARAVDTRPAVVAAIIIAAIVAVFMFLWAAGPQGLLNTSHTTTETVVIIIGMGILGAVACVTAFILFAVSDSVTRQFWPEKLHCYDYLRQGMVFSKPVGETLLKSVALAFVLAGYWTLLLHFFPALYFTADTIFISQSAALPPLRLLTGSAWHSYFIILSIFLVIAGRAYGQWKKRWIAAVLIIAACGVVITPLFNYGPGWLEIITGALFGIALFLIYQRWDFLTILLSYFLFLSLIGSTSGWIISNSPDLFVFIWIAVLFMVITAVGFFAVSFGEDERKLPHYVPEYVEEHAREERIEQELQIARGVQQSFLPVETPNIKDVDIAAVCKPAFETGGDYYDFIRLDEHRLAVAIGDVSGKGIQAAFYMTFIKGILHSLSRETYSPGEVLKRANRYFYENANKSTFVSLIYGVINLKEQTFTFARAGHNPILHINTDDHRVEELRPNGLGIGLTKEKIFDNKISEIKLSITGSDLFLLYTDGITEALNEAHQFYGADRLMKLINKHKFETASTVISIVSDQVSNFIGSAKQHDDMTVMAIRFDREF